MSLNNLAITCTMMPIGNRTSDGTKLRTEYRLNNLGVLEREPLRVRSAAADVANSAVITDEAVAPYTTLTRRDYCGNYVYCNGRLERVLTPGGYISGGEQHFYITDYQGNVRVVLDSAGRPVEVNSYYPYGALTGAGQSVQPYKYGAKELDRENGLNLYDSQARHYDPILGRTTTLDPKATEYFSISPYAWCAGNPVKFVDPDGRQVFGVHGTFSNNTTWKDSEGITAYASRTFGNKLKNFEYNWSGGNKPKKRTEAAIGLIHHIRSVRKEVDSSEPITLVGHSHGGNVAIEAINLIVKMPEFSDVEINLITINTPVRTDYQLSKKAKERIGMHINVYDKYDPIQVLGGGSLNISPPIQLFKKYHGEIGPAGRIFKDAKNIEVDNPQNLFHEFHNSHNRLQDWINK